MPTNLIHGVFNPTENVLRNTLIRLLMKGYFEYQFTWIGPEEAPSFDRKDRGTVVVLDAALDNPGNTFEMASAWGKDVHEQAGWCWKDLRTHPQQLRLTPGSEPFRPFTLRWRRIKLDANRGHAPLYVEQSPVALPGLALLYATAQHPERVRAIDYKEWCCWCIPGVEYDSDLADEIPPSRMRHPVVTATPDREVLLGSCLSGDNGMRGGMAVPIFVD